MSDFDAVPITLIAARGANGVIGAAGGLPWRLSSDLKRFQAATIGKPVVMGRKTWNSLPRALPGRTNIVVTRHINLQADGALVFSSVEAALAAARAVAGHAGVGEVCVIGGADIYAQCLPLASRLLLTDVDASPDGDAFFPEVDPACWTIVQETAHPAGPRDDHACVERLWERVA